VNDELKWIREEMVMALLMLVFWAMSPCGLVGGYQHLIERRCLSSGMWCCAVG
jgi:hypothetical protein